jgi:hypothetical protein
MRQEADCPVFIVVFMVFQGVRESPGRRFPKPRAARSIRVGGTITL